MTRLLLHNKEIETLFDLLGKNEDDMTKALGWALYRCPGLLQKFLKTSVRYHGEVDSVILRLQHHKEKAGVTDIECELPGKFHIIVEAKRGWELPRASQLKKYAPRLRVSEARTKRFVMLSECSSEYASRHFDGTKIGGFPVVPISWKTITHLGVKAAVSGSNAEKRLIQELLAYLKGVMAMRRTDPNWVYVLSLGKQKPDYSSISFIETVEKKRRYYHPVGPAGGWPLEPPTYLAFRYGGKLRSIHYVEKCEVLTNLGSRMPEIDNEEHDPCFLYYLGPPFRPDHDVRTGERILRATRVWCILDTLFTCKTISSARDLSEKRRQRGD
jgi:hypothetical protein